MATLFEKDIKPVGYAQIVVERGLDRFPNGLTYAIPPELDDLQAGDRVEVPLGRSNTRASGYVIDILTSVEDDEKSDPRIDPAKTKVITRRDEACHRLPIDLVILARWMSGYYCTPIGMVFATMLPGPVKRDVGRVSKTFIDLAEKEDQQEKTKLTPKQKQVIRAIEKFDESKRPVEIRTLAEIAEVKTLGPIRKLIKHGLLTQTIKSGVEAKWIQSAIDRFIPKQLTEEQISTIEAISTELNKGFSTHLIHGVTGSGKTEVYIRLLEQAVEAGKTGLLLVPEISLTPQTGGRLIGRFPNHRVAVLHSGLTAAQRNQQWTLAAEGKADVIIGARSAVFAPVPENRLGLVIVDEEHDGSYKQDQLPRYHGRDIAIRRAQIANCPVILGSATPSLESWWNATKSGVDSNIRFRLHRMTKRVPGTALPKVTIVDFREQMKLRKDRTHIHLIGPLLEAEIGRTLQTDHQVLLMLNRRGYANYIACPDQNCGWLMTCDHCDVTMVYHRNRDIPAGGYLRCHHCLTEQKLPPACPLCAKKIVNFGLGTQRVESELSKMFPQLVEGKTMMRVDSDSMHGSAHFHDVLSRFARNELKLLVGTQMIAKGLDFPLVRLVGVINADTAINLPDFRASERTFQLVNQVAGRSGRGQTSGKVVVQSFQPTAMPIRLAAAHDYEGFAAAELAVRKRFGLPPITRMARIVIRHEDHTEAAAIAVIMARRLRELADEQIRLKGPAPCPISRIAGKHRQQIEILAPTAGLLQKLLTTARNEGLVKADSTTAVDVDPIALL